jgi:hypothetical protein
MQTGISRTPNGGSFLGGMPRSSHHQSVEDIRSDIFSVILQHSFQLSIDDGLFKLLVNPSILEHPRYTDEKV